MQRLLAISTFAVVCAAPVAARAQNETSPAPAVTQSGDPISADYPSDRAGIFVARDKQWVELRSQMPSKTRAAHSIAAGLSYGLVPAKIVAEYPGDHATRTAETQPILCICHFSSIPGSPVLVKLHAKKDSRELDGGKMIVYPIVGGAKMADANKTDLVLADVSQPDPQVWLVRPQAPLAPGEYALMLGTQNMNIFPFTVDPPSPPAAP